MSRTKDTLPLLTVFYCICAVTDVLSAHFCTTDGGLSGQSALRALPLRRDDVRSVALLGAGGGGGHAGAAGLCVHRGTYWAIFVNYDASCMG
jgi:nanoRNase/pAp phosphatase (c-di-AMP/oligoRNAs hydrolase)